MLEELLDVVKLHERNTKSIYTDLLNDPVRQSNKQLLRWMQDLNRSDNKIRKRNIT